MGNEIFWQIVGTKPAKNDIENQRVNWFTNLKRLNPEQSVVRAYSLKVSGYMARGLPRKKWIDGVKDKLRKHIMTAT